MAYVQWSKVKLVGGVWADHLLADWRFHDALAGRFCILADFRLLFVRTPLKISEIGCV
jgi:hypothetical protein